MQLRNYSSRHAGHLHRAPNGAQLFFPHLGRYSDDLLCALNPYPRGLVGMLQNPPNCFGDAVTVLRVGQFQFVFDRVNHKVLQAFLFRCALLGLAA